MTTIRLSGSSEQLGHVSQAGEFSLWDEEWLRQGAKTELVTSLGRSSLILDALEYEPFPDGEARASFVEKDDFALGREDSKHGVRFGQLIINGKGIHESPDFVAMKSFDDESELKNEWALNQHLNGVFDDQYAFLPLGVYADKDKNLSMVTAYEHQVQSLDNIFWADPSLEPEALRPATVRRAMAMGFLALGMLHGARVIHHDAQVKNMATGRNGVRFIDLEDAEVLHPDEIDDPYVVDKTRSDISSFITSAGQVIENKEPVAAAIGSAKQRAHMYGQYRQGVRVGRASQDGTFVPNFERINRDYIYDQIDKAIKP